MKAIIFDFNRTLYDPKKNSLIPGCKEILNVLSKRYQLVLITTATISRQNLIRNLDINKYFRSIIICKNKNEKIFLSCIQTLGVKPNEILAVGDRVRGEIEIGNKLGLVTVQFFNGPFAKELPENDSQKPGFVIKRLEDLLRVVLDLE